MDGQQGDATQDCLDKTILSDINGIKQITFAKTTGQFKFQINLPADMSCNHCVFQWKYVTGNNWGINPVTGQGGLGFGPQEQYRSCADITITSRASPKVT